MSLCGCRRVHRVAKLLRRLEEGNALGRYIDLRAGLWIAAGTGVALAGPVASETANLNLVTPLERANDGDEQGIDDHFPNAPGVGGPECGSLCKISFLVL